MPIGSRSQGPGPSIHRSQSRPWGVTFHARSRASRCLSLQIPTGIITRQPMVRAPDRTSEPTSGLFEHRGVPAGGPGHRSEGESEVSNPVAADRSITTDIENYS